MKQFTKLHHLGVKIDRQDWVQLRLICIDKETNVSNIIRSLVRKYISNHTNYRN